MGRVIIPVFPGIASAFGMLSADVRHDYVKTQIGIAQDLDLGVLNRVFTEMESRAEAQLSRQGFEGDALELSRFADLRYLGQSYELCLPVPPGTLGAASVGALVSGFHGSHERAYGYARAGEKVELVNLRLVALGKLPRSGSLSARPLQGLPDHQPVGRRPVVFEGRAVETPIYKREHLQRERPLMGPAVIEQLDSTTVVPPGFRFAVESGGNILIESGEG
jgi:N-methylhydantoinase A